MSNVLADDKHHQVVALGRLGWSLRRIERTTGVRRETISGYLKAAGIAVPGRQPLYGTLNRHNLHYVTAKVHRAGHWLSEMLDHRRPGSSGETGG